MDKREKKAVDGYIRINYDGQNMVKDIIQIIFEYYYIPFISDSVILTDSIDIRELLSPKLISILKRNDFRSECDVYPKKSLSNKS